MLARAAIALEMERILGVYDDDEYIIYIISALHTTVKKASLPSPALISFVVLNKTCCCYKQ